MIASYERSRLLAWSVMVIAVGCALEAAASNSAERIAAAGEQRGLR